MSQTSRPSPVAALFFWGGALVAAALLSLVTAAALSGSFGWSPVVGLAIGGLVGLALLELARRIAKVSRARRVLVAGVLSSLLLGGAAAGVFLGFGLDVEAVIVAGEELAGKERAAAAAVSTEGGAKLTASCEWRSGLPGGGLDEPVFPVIEGWESAMPREVSSGEGSVWTMAYSRPGRRVQVVARSGERFGADFFQHKYAYQNTLVRGVDTHCVLVPKRDADGAVWRSGKWLVTVDSADRQTYPALGAVLPALLRVFPSDLPPPPRDDG